MKIVGLVSAYKEGALVRGAIDSLEQVGLDGMLVYEGPAGPPLGDDVPDSEYPPWITNEPFRWTHHGGRWRTDGRKRNAMLQEAKARHTDGPLWGVWLDGDEILVNGQYLRDLLQAVVWNDERDEQPTIRYPLRLIEADGAISTISNRVVRLDLIHSVDISTSVVTNIYGVEEAWGNVVEDSELWMRHFLGAMDHGRMTAWPPLPCEPHIFHRSHLRHPSRRGQRMHEQEADELRKAGKLT